MNKRCFKCGNKKPIEAFYVHPRMGDGHLGKCKECAKRDSFERHQKKSLDPVWVSSEAERHRKKQARYRALGVACKRSVESLRKWRKENPQKARAQRLAAKALKSGKITRATKCSRCSIENVRLEKHHPDYSKPLDIVWLCSKCHGYEHRKHK
jgi:hypothetical protein